MAVVTNARDWLDDYGKPAWIIAMVLGFILFWPVGLAILGYMIWSGRMGCSGGKWGRWQRERRDEFRKFGAGHGRRGGSGNIAFEEYRMETLKRLEDEQEEFQEFLFKLRQAKDKQEFEQFMTERRNKPKTQPENSNPVPDNGQFNPA